MADYLLVYLGGEQPATPEAGQQHFARYMEWLESLGDAAVNPMNPLKNTHTVNPDGSITDGGSVGMSGFTIIEADSIEAAVSMAKTCPFLDINGSLEVSELVQMSG